MSDEETKQETKQAAKLTRGRYISVMVFVLGILFFAGADTFQDFYKDMESRISGSSINYSSLAEFCGWTGSPRPGESRFAYGLRSVWNMLSAMLGMTALSFVAVGALCGLIFGIFYLTGAFKDEPIDP